MYSHQGIDDPTPFPGRWEPLGEQAPTSRHLNPDGDSRGDGEPDLGVNPGLDRPEVVWSLVGPTGESAVWSHWAGLEWSPPLALSPEGPGSRDPRVTFLAAGGTGIAWRSPGDQVIYRERQGSGGVWSAEVVLTDVVEAAGRPDLAGFVDGPRVAFPVARPSGWEIVVASRVGALDASPVFVRQPLALSDCTCDPEVRVEEQDGVLWITWRQDDSDLAWSRLESQGWSAPRLVPIAAGGDLEAARFQAKREALRSP